MATIWTDLGPLRYASEFALPRGARRNEMKAWRISSFGIDNLEAFEAPIPKANAGQVVIRVHAVSLNYRDLMMVKGFYNPKMGLPRIPCSDGAGEIVEAGEGVTDFKA